MGRFNPLPFSESYEFVCVKAFPCSGRAFEPGEPFDKSLVDSRRLRQLFEARMIAPVSDSDEREVPALLKSGGRKKKTAAPVKREARHAGFGRFYIFEGSRKVQGPYPSLAEAKAVIDGAHG